MRNIHVMASIVRHRFNGIDLLLFRHNIYAIILTRSVCMEPQLSQHESARW